ncbi:MAG: sigma-70 family RNA polymerase sigma factor [Bradymonadia bacterium]
MNIHYLWKILVLVESFLKTLTDEALMLRFSTGETDAFEELLHRYERRVLGFVRRFVSDDATAADLMQETFLRVIRAADRYQATAAFSTWILRIARNLCTDHARKHKSESRHVALDEFTQKKLSSTDRTDGATLDGEIRSKIDQAVDRLPPKQKEVFVLRQLLNLSFKEIAVVVDTSENTVKSRMRYALEGLRLELHDFYHSSTKGGSVS